MAAGEDQICHVKKVEDNDKTILRKSKFIIKTCRIDSIESLLASMGGTIYDAMGY